MGRDSHVFLPPPPPPKLRPASPRHLLFPPSLCWAVIPRLPCSSFLCFAPSLSRSCCAASGLGWAYKWPERTGRRRWMREEMKESCVFPAIHEWQLSTAVVVLHPVEMHHTLPGSFLLRLPFIWQAAWQQGSLFLCILGVCGAVGDGSSCPSATSLI